MDVTQPYPYDDEILKLKTQPERLTLALEVAAYALLVLFALLVRVAELDTVPLSDNEAQQALAAWRFIEPSAPGADIVPNSPLLFALHSFTFSTLGANEFTARIFTALAGIALILSPLLFRDWLGRIRTLALSLILFFSPVVLITSRADSPVVWTILIAVLGLWALWRYWDSRRSGFAILATVCLAAVLLLTEPTGAIFTLILLGAAAFAWWAARTNDDGNEALALARERLRGWPWLSGVLIAALVVVIVSTLFLTHPAGMSAISALLGMGARGLSTMQAGSYTFFPIWITLFYEPVLVIFGIFGTVWLARTGRLSFVERFFLGWLIFGAAASIIYAGTNADHGLWLVLPLAGLTSRMAVELLQDPDRLIWYAPGWAKWALAVIMVALLLVLSVHTQALGRALLKAPEGAVQLSQVDARSAVWVLVALLFIITGYFMAGSVWGAGTATRGWALGVLAFGLVTSLGSGMNAAIYDADNPAELWHTQAISRNTMLLRQTLEELSQRESGGFPQLSITVLAPQDGAVAWLVRDYPNAQFIQDVSEARTQPIVLLPQLVENPDLGGSYVGQNFVISRAWSPQSVRLTDFPAWWLQRQTRTPATALNHVVLWLRQDIYSGVNLDEFQG